MKKLIYVSILLVVGVLFTACGGAGSPGSVDDGNGNNSSSSSGDGGNNDNSDDGGNSGSSSKKRTLPTTTDNKWKDFNFDIFDKSELTIDMEVDSNNTYEIPDGKWKFSRRYEPTSKSTVYYYYEFTVDSESIEATKYVRIWRVKKTDSEIEKYENCPDWEYERDLIPDKKNTTSIGYYLDDNEWVEIKEYDGANNIDQDSLPFAKIQKKDQWDGELKRNSDTTKIFYERWNHELKYYFQKIE